MTEASDLQRERFRLKETIVTITAQERDHLEAAKEEIAIQRGLLEEFIRSDPFFLVTLEPYELPAKDAPLIVREMARAASAVGIGPMSGVAGTIALFALEAMIRAGATHAVVDNGGDVALVCDRPILMGIYAGPSPLKDLAFEIPPGKKPLGICTSSGTVGPSISFGFADAAVVVSDDVPLADAAATALGNAIGLASPLSDSFHAVAVPGVTGALVIRGEEMALVGELPPLRRARLRPELITRG
ncbi:UPF0280 family protein [Candidatus Methanocrinis natronophilus]|uniref:UPF0280 protein P0O15_06645 n=1 Tax=Candidatus Methanocrinis natronophilus TaxID=3033396 RepID=A0ABT5X828_9EURY|nr:UPF0280 family protein [Candidatus Methanocrinis natronophilus]MDF0590845.1 UPF0280 family protein [Candidatus Methanocrinis natronophilus]